MLVRGLMMDWSGTRAMRKGGGTHTAGDQPQFGHRAGLGPQRCAMAQSDIRVAVRQAQYSPSIRQTAGGQI
jgi:hypothetical protein